MKHITPSVGGVRCAKYTFRAVSVLTGEVHFEGNQPDLNRFLARVRTGSVHLPIVAEELRVEKALKKRAKPKQDQDYDPDDGTIYASWAPEKRV